MGFSRAGGFVTGGPHRFVKRCLGGFYYDIQSWEDFDLNLCGKFVQWVTVICVWRQANKI